MINPAEMANIARAEQSLWWYRGMREISFALLDPLMGDARGRLALEAGCGTGYFAWALEQRYGMRVVAVDLESEAIRYCHQRALRTTRASIAELPFPNGAFEIVASMDVLPHFAPGEEHAPFAELVRVLKPGGLLLVRVAALDVFRSRHSEYVWERQRFKRRRLRELARAHQLRIIRLTYANFLLTPVAFLKFRIWEPLLRRPPASGVGPVPAFLDQLLYVPLALERRWVAAGGSFPWGQSLLLLARKP